MKSAAPCPTCSSGGFQTSSTTADGPQTLKLVCATDRCPSGPYLELSHLQGHTWSSAIFTAIPEAQASPLAFRNMENNALTLHLPLSATKTSRERAVQASCWICVHDPFWKSIVTVGWTITLFYRKNMSTCFTLITNKQLPICSETSISQLLPR